MYAHVFLYSLHDYRMLFLIMLSDRCTGEVVCKKKKRNNYYYYFCFQRLRI